jgi:hypothetical protein
VSIATNAIYSLLRRRSHSAQLLVLLALAVGVSALSCKQNKKDEANMPYQTVEQLVAGLNPDDDSQVAAAAERIRTKAYKEAHTLVELAHSEDEQTSQNASMILLELGLPAAEPLLQAADSAGPANMIWDIQTAAEISHQLTLRLVSRLNDMLSDTSDVPQPELAPKTEEKHAPRRVCDEAYLILRSLLAVEEEPDAILNRQVFLDMTDEERDEEIKRFTESGKWIQLTDESESASERM